MFENFTFARFRFTIKAETRIYLPAYKGGTLRGGFGHILRRTVCIRKKAACDGCMLRQQCTYSYIFDTSPPHDSDMLRKYSDIPRPFIIEPPLDGKRHYQPGEEMSFGVVLIGKAIELLPYFILSFSNLGKSGLGAGRGKFSLQKVESGDREIYLGEPETLIGEPHILCISDLTSGIDLDRRRVKFNFLTPVRMKYNGRFTDEPEFHILIRNLLRRVSNLAYFHCGLTPDVDLQDMISAAKDISAGSNNTRWYDWHRYSSRQKTGMELGGLLGDITYAGHLERFIPLLLLGEYVHVGKNTSFGLGRYGLILGEDIC